MRCPALPEPSSAGDEASRLDRAVLCETVLATFSTCTLMTPILHKPIAVALGALAWTLIGFLFALPAVSSQADWQAPLLRSLIDWWSWGIIAVVVFYCDRALPIADRQLAKRLLAH